MTWRLVCLTAHTLSNMALLQWHSDSWQAVKRGQPKVGKNQKFPPNVKSAVYDWHNWQQRTSWYTHARLHTSRVPPPHLSLSLSPSLSFARVYIFTLTRTYIHTNRQTNGHAHTHTYTYTRPIHVARPLLLHNACHISGDMVCTTTTASRIICPLQRTSRLSSKYNKN